MEVFLQTLLPRLLRRGFDICYPCLSREVRPVEQATGSAARLRWLDT
jgi:hypothetical protein